MTTRGEALLSKRVRARNRRKANPQKYRGIKLNRYHNEPGYADRVKAKIAEKRRAEPALYLFNKAKRRAKKENREFNIELTDIVIPNLCPVLGIKIGPLMGKHQGATIDRIDNSKGYIKGNILVISKRANTLKSDATKHELAKLAKFYNKRS